MPILSCWFPHPLHFMLSALQSHPKFNTIAEVAPLLYSRELQVRSCLWRRHFFGGGCLPAGCSSLSCTLVATSEGCGNCLLAYLLPLIPLSHPRPTSPYVQMGEEKKPKRITLGSAVASGIIANQTLAYFIGRTYLFAERVGGTQAGLAARG
jgi:hypothetical protein